MKLLLRSVIEKEIEVESFSKLDADLELEEIQDEPIGKYVKNLDFIALEGSEIPKFLKEKSEKRFNEITDSSKPEEKLKELCLSYEELLQELTAVKDLSNQISQRYNQVIWTLPDPDKCVVQFLDNIEVNKLNYPKEFKEQKLELFYKLLNGYKDEIKDIDKTMEDQMKNTN